MPLVNGFLHLSVVSGQIKVMHASTSFADITSDLRVFNGQLQFRDNKVELPTESLVESNGSIKVKQ